MGKLTKQQRKHWNSARCHGVRIGDMSRKLRCPKESINSSNGNRRRETSEGSSAEEEN